MLTPKTSLKRVLISGLSIALWMTMINGLWDYPIGYTQEKRINFHNKEEENWLSEWRANVEDNQLYLFAVKLFKVPLECKAKITDTFNDQKFGTLLFIFTGGNELKIETFPPESSRITLRVPKGFPDEQDARDVLEQYVQSVGIGLDWSKPIHETKGTEQILSFDSVDPGYNATAFQVYQNRLLIEIGFSMAL